MLTIQMLLIYIVDSMSVKFSTLSVIKLQFPFFQILYPRSVGKILADGASEILESEDTP